MILTSVLLPAPLAPMSAWTSPARTARLAALSATTESNRLATSRASRRRDASFITHAEDRGEAPPRSSVFLGRCADPGSGWALAGQDLVHGVGGIGLHADIHAVEGIELRIVDLLQSLGIGVRAVVPDLGIDLDD